MIEAFLHLFHFHRPKSFWRDIKLSEMSELYLSMSLKTMALSLVGIFIPVYLYELNYSILEIAWFFFMLYAFRLPSHIFFGYLTAWRGPKHVMRYSYVLLLVLLILLYTLPEYEWPLPLISFSLGVHLAAFFTGYHVDFSKIRSHQSAAEQLGNMMIYTKIAAASGPLVGGLVATVFGIEWTILVATIFLLAAVLPLMSSGEPVIQNQVIRWQGVLGPKFRRPLLASAGAGLDQSAAGLVWPLIMAVYIFDDNVYASIGAITSLSFIVTIVSSKLIGKISDRQGGKKVLRASATLLFFTHLSRLFIVNPVGAAISNIANELGLIGTRVPYMKGYYGFVDELKGQRIVAIMCMEAANCILRIFIFGAVIVLIPVIGEEPAIYGVMFAGALGSIFMGTAKFKELK